MRIAFIAPPWVPVPPPAYGGTEAVLDVLARGLAAAGHDVLLCATGDSTCPVERWWTHEEALGVGAVGAGLAEIRHVIEAYDAARDWGADVVHDHTLVGPLYSQRFRDLGVVTTNHGPFDRDLGALYAALAEHVALICISHHQASTSPAPVAAVIHHGLDVAEYPPGRGDGGYALFLGRMSPDKGVHVAARVARRAGVALRIAAKMREPAERAYFEQCVAPLLGETVSYVGEVGGREKQDLLAGAVCLLNPIAWPEPFGMVMIEALATGTPVVATPCGAAPEIIDHGTTGFLAEDEDGLVEALGRVADLDRAACRQVAKERFSVERMVARHLEVYRASARQAPT